MRELEIAALGVARSREIDRARHVGRHVVAREVDARHCPVVVERREKLSAAEKSERVPPARIVFSQEQYLP